MLVAADDNRDHAAAGGALDGQRRHLFLHALLQLLRLFHQLERIHR
jgi:hypothetical protein